MKNKYIIIRAILAMTTQLPAVFCGDNFSAEEKTHLAGRFGEQNIIQAFDNLRRLNIDRPSVLQLDEIVNLQILGLERPTLQHIRAYNYLGRENIAPTFFRILGTCLLFDQNVNHPTLETIRSYSEPMEHLHTIGCDYTDPTFIEPCRYMHIKKYYLPTTTRQVNALADFCDLPIFEGNLPFFDKIYKKTSENSFKIYKRDYFINICNTIIHVEDVLKLPISPKLLKDCSIIMEKKKEKPSMEILGLLSWCRLHDVDFRLGSSVKILTVLNFLKDAKMNISETSEEIKFGICYQAHQTNNYRQLYFDSEQLKKWKEQRQLEAKWFKSAYCVSATLELPLSEDIIRKALGTDDSSFSLFAYLFEQDKMRSPYKIATATHCLHLGLKLTYERLEACEYLFFINDKFPSKYKIDALAYPNGEKLDEYDCCYSPQIQEEATLCYAYMDMTSGKGLSEYDFKQLVGLNNSLKESTSNTIEHKVTMGELNNNFNALRKKIESVQKFLYIPDCEMTLAQVLYSSLDAFKYIRESIKVEPKTHLITACVYYNLHTGKYPSSRHLNLLSLLIKSHEKCSFNRTLFFRTFEYLIKEQFNMAKEDENPMFFGQSDSRLIDITEWSIDTECSIETLDIIEEHCSNSLSQEKREMEWFIETLEIVEEHFSENKEIIFPSKEEIEKKIAIKQKETDKDRNEDSSDQEDEDHHSPHMESID